MSKTRDTGFLGNVVKVDASGNVSFVSGSTTLATINTSGQLSGSSPVLSASYASNAETLDGLDSTVFTLTSSFNAQTASFIAFTGSVNSFSASILSYTASQNITNGTFTTTASFNAQTASLNSFSASVLAQTASLNSFSSSVLTFTGSAATRLGALEAATASLYTTTSSLNSFSASVLTFTGSAATRLGALESYTSSLNNKTSSFATTGSNTFIGTQTISGSVLQSGSFTTTGTIIAQTINVQTVTSSIVYSSGSNIFGNLLGDSQTFTGSVLITGSLTISTGGNVSAPTIFGSTIACSPIGCFATSCATSFIGGNMSGTTIYGSTAVCSPVGKFTTCLDLGGALTGTSATFSGNVVLGTTALSGGGAAQWLTANGTPYGGGLISSVSGVIKAYYYYDNSANAAMVQAAAGVGVQLWANNTVALSIASTGAATFSSTISGTTIYGSTAVCSPVGKFTTCIDAGSGTFSGCSTFFCTAQFSKIQKHPTGYWYKIPFSVTKNTNVGTAGTFCIVNITSDNSFNEMFIYVEYASRLQSQSDTQTQVSSRMYGINRFNSGTIAVTNSYTLVGGAGCVIDTHAPITAVAVGTCAIVVKVDFSTCTSFSSFVWGEIRVYSIENLNNSLTIPYNEW